MRATRHSDVAQRLRPENAYPNVAIATKAAYGQLPAHFGQRGPLLDTLPVRVDVGRLSRDRDGETVLWSKGPYKAVNATLALERGEATILVARLPRAIGALLGVSNDRPNVRLIPDAGLVRELIHATIEQARAELPIMAATGHDITHMAAKATAIRLARQFCLGEQLDDFEREGLILPTDPRFASHAVVFSDCREFEHVSRLGGIFDFSARLGDYMALRFGNPGNTVQNNADGRHHSYTIADAALLRFGVPPAAAVPRSVARFVNGEVGGDWEDVTDVSGVVVPPAAFIPSAQGRPRGLESMTVAPGMQRLRITPDDGSSIEDNCRLVEDSKAIDPAKLAAVREGRLSHAEKWRREKAAGKTTEDPDAAFDAEFRDNQPWDPKAVKDKNKGRGITDAEGVRALVGIHRRFGGESPRAQA